MVKTDSLKKDKIRFGFPLDKLYFEKGPRYYPIFDEVPPKGWKIFDSPAQAFYQLCLTYKDEMAHLLEKAKQEALEETRKLKEKTEMKN